MENAATKLQPVIADALSASRHVFVRDLKVMALIGVHPHEEVDPQQVVISVDLTVSESGDPHEDRIYNVVCYEKLVNGIKAIVASGHVNLVETLAEKIAAHALETELVKAARVRIDKPGAFVDASSVGVEIERVRGLNA